MPSTLWLTDRSRIVDGLGFCPMARFLGYHFGPTGYGIQLKGTKVPLVRGIGIHDALGYVLEWCRDHDPEIVQALRPGVEDARLLPVPEQVVRDAVTRAHANYMIAVTARGYGYLQQQDDVQYVIREQCYLIEGLIWAWCLEVLTDVLRRGRVIEVEHDSTYVSACTCCLGPGVLTKADHEARDCQGIGLMQKADFILEGRVTKELEYYEFKSTGSDSSTFGDKWETMIQMFATVLDTERRLGRQIQLLYVHGLITGRREGDYNYESGKKDGFIRQQSVFCQGYRKPPTPPMEQEEWKALYEYFDEYEQKTKRLGKAYRKTGVWEIPDAWIPDGMSKAEYWARFIPPEARRKHLVMVGPFSRQATLVPEFIEELNSEEARWRERCWRLYEMAEICGPTTSRTSGTSASCIGSSRAPTSAAGTGCTTNAASRIFASSVKDGTTPWAQGGTFRAGRTTRMSLIRRLRADCSSLKRGLARNKYRNSDGLHWTSPRRRQREPPWESPSRSRARPTRPVEVSWVRTGEHLAVRGWLRPLRRRKAWGEGGEG